jgi:hypothetical protein
MKNLLEFDDNIKTPATVERLTVILEGLSVDVVADEQRPHMRALPHILVSRRQGNGKYTLSSSLSSSFKPSQPPRKLPGRIELSEDPLRISYNYCQTLDRRSHVRSYDFFLENPSS